MRYNAQLESLKNIAVGDEVKFGYYEQDNSKYNGKEEIEWQVLAVEDGKALIISKYGLDCQPYNTDYESVTWETCTLRKWLNNDFYEVAFDEKHKEIILRSNVTADKNPKFDTNPGNDTVDKVFLLSINEVDKYFSSVAKRKCQATAYAEEQGAYAKEDNGCCWWLQLPVRSDDDVYVNFDGGVTHGLLRVYNDGDLYYIGSDTDYIAVRPAMWVKID